MNSKCSRPFFASIFTTVVLSTAAFAVPVIAFAQSSQAADVAASAGLSNADLMAIIGGVINIVLGLLGVVFLVLVIYAGYMWMTAGGSAERVDKAKKILINATVGLVITLAAYGIATFVLNLLSGATGTGAGGGANGSVTIERLSGALGSGAIRDHYPKRNATDVARNTKIFVTFRDAMDIASFISGYDTSKTPLDVTDDTTSKTINSSNVEIYKTADGEQGALTNVDTSFTDDLKTFVFDPVDYLGSSTENTSYTVKLSTKIEDADGTAVLAGDGGYEWSFEVGTTIDLTPPSVTSVTPFPGGTYDRNIAVQITFSEAVDPTSASGIRTATSGFSNITTVGSSGAPATGTYEISNGYETVTFATDDACGTNSCGETITCLSANDDLTVTAKAATVGANPPQVDDFPYDGIVDTAANSLDGNGDGTGGDNYSWAFKTTNDINLDGPKITAITPNILDENVALDQSVEVTFDSVLMSSTVSSDAITFDNKETSSGTSHEMWYRFDTSSLASDGSVVQSTTQKSVNSLVTISHGVFLESVDGKSYLYGVTVGSGIKNEYQNCYVPGEGPTESGGDCGVTTAEPYCCNGVASTAACSLF